MRVTSLEGVLCATLGVLCRLPTLPTNAWLGRTPMLLLIMVAKASKDLWTPSLLFCIDAVAILWLVFEDEDRDSKSYSLYRLGLMKTFYRYFSSRSNELLQKTCQVSLKDL